MSTSFHCEDKDTLLDYLYGEIDDERRRQVKAHLRTCAACAEEIETLQAVRRDLLEWQPPEMALNFSIVQKPATVLRPARPSTGARGALSGVEGRWSMASLPAWAQVAAAALVFAVGAAIANVQVRYGADGVTVSTGWMQPAAVAAPAAQEAPAVAGSNSAAPATEDWRPALVALEQSLRAEMQSMRRGDPGVRAVSAPVDAVALMRRVDARISETEQRHREELAQRMTQFARDMQSDMFVFNQSLRQLQGKTVSIEGSQRQMIDLVRRVSTQVP